MQEDVCFIPIFYTRGVNNPYTEGCIKVVDNMINALLLQGIKSINFNYKYSSNAPSSHQNCSEKFEQEIPVVNREELLHGGKRSVIAYSSLMETLTAFRFLLTERRICANAQAHKLSCIVNIVNCFRYPRVFAKRFFHSSIVLHFYMRLAVADGLANIAVDKADRILTSSRTIANYIGKTYGISRKKIETLYPPVDTNLYQPVNKKEAKIKLGLSRKNKIILYVGNLRRNRFPEEIVLTTLSKLTKRDPAVQLLVFAPVNNENVRRYEEIKTRMKSLGVTDKVRIKIKDLSEAEKNLVYNGSDVFIFPCLNHATAIEPPLTVLEAMSSGLPVVSNNVSSVCEIVNDGLDGYIVDFNNIESSQLANKLSSFLMDEEIMAKLSYNARSKIADKVSFANSCRKLVRIFNDLCATMY